MERNVLLESGSCKESNLSCALISSPPAHGRHQANSHRQIWGREGTWGTQRHKRCSARLAGTHQRAAKVLLARGKFHIERRAKLPAHPQGNCSSILHHSSKIPVHPHPAPLTKRKSGQADRECTVYSSKKKKRKKSNKHKNPNQTTRVW